MLGRMKGSLSPFSIFVLLREAENNEKKNNGMGFVDQLIV